jgi:hypothetical protein
MGLKIFLAISVKTYCLDIPSLDDIVGNLAVPRTPLLLSGKFPMLSCARNSKFELKLCKFYKGLKIFLTISVKTYCLDTPSLDNIVGNLAVPTTPRLLSGKFPRLRYAQNAKFEVNLCKLYMGLKIFLVISVKTYCLDTPSLDVIVGNLAVPTTPRLLSRKLPRLKIARNSKFELNLCKLCMGLKIFLAISVKTYCLDIPSLDVIVGNPAVARMKNRSRGIQSRMIRYCRRNTCYLLAELITILVIVILSFARMFGQVAQLTGLLVPLSSLMMVGLLPNPMLKVARDEK